MRKSKAFFSSKTKYGTNIDNSIEKASYSSLMDFFLMLTGVLCLLCLSGANFLVDMGALSFRIGMLLLLAWAEARSVGSKTHCRMKSESMTHCN